MGSSAPEAATWSLVVAKPTVPAPESVFAPKLSNGSTESSTETVLSSVDGRTPVDPTTFAPGGKYRSIVKLFARFENAPAGVWAMGTGWLVKPDVFVTAGHCSCDWSYSYGRAVEVKAYIGYQGNQSTGNADVQFRSVKRIVTTKGWIKGQGLKPYDVSFMQVNTPFTGISPIKFDITPAQGNIKLGVVGYPGDLQDAKTKEKGAYMYEMFLDTQFDLSTQPDHMLQYRIDTFGGNSGSPVFRQQDLVSIGAHVYGGTLNSASVIGGIYGNRYSDYLAVFDTPMPTKALTWVALIKQETESVNVPVGTKVVTVLKPTPPNGTMKPPGLDESALTSHDGEGFMDLLNIVKTALPIGAGLLGGPVGVLAGVALNAASQFAGKSAESTLTSSTMQQGSVERAILAEATMQAIRVHPGLEEFVLSSVKDTVMKALPTIKQVAPRIAGAALEPALQVALDMLRKYNQNAKTGTEGTFTEPFRPPIHYSEATFEIDNLKTEAFLGSAKASLDQGQQESAFDRESQEGFWDIIKAGTSLAGQGIAAAAQKGLPILAGMLAQSSGTEALETSSSETSFRGPLAQRALVADAALSAVLQVNHDNLQEAGFFDAFTKAVKVIAPVVIKAAPIVAKNVLPIVGSIVKLTQESSLTNPVGQDGDTSTKKPIEFSFADSGKLANAKKMEPANATKKEPANATKKEPANATEMKPADATEMEGQDGDTSVHNPIAKSNALENKQANEDNLESTKALK